MAVTRAERGDRAARQAQVARAQAADARRGDALARERFSLDRQDGLRQDSLRNNLDAQNRAREAKARTTSGITPSAGPSQDRGMGAATGASAARPGGTAATDAARTEPGAKAGSEPDDAGPAAAGRAGRSAPGTAASNSSQDEQAETKGTDNQRTETAMPVALAPTAPAAVPQQASAAAPGGGDQSAGAGNNDGKQAASVSAEPSQADSASEAGVHGREAGTAALPFADALAETPATATATAADASALPPPPATGSDRAGSADKAAASPHASPAPAPEPPVPLGAVPMTIGLRSMVGTNRFEMRLDPAELGRIDVTLDIDEDGDRVSAILVADNPATLALLRRDADSLQQALAQAGFSAGEAGLIFRLRGDDASQGGSRGEADRQEAGRPAAAGAKPDASPFDAIPLRAQRPVSGLDIRI